MQNSFTRLMVGDPAPDIVVSDTQGNPVHLASLWKSGPTLISFLRHFGCIHCRARLAELEEHRDQLQSVGLQLVALGESKHAARYCGNLAPHLNCYADNTNEGYYTWVCAKVQAANLRCMGWM